MFKLWLYAYNYQKKDRNPRNKVEETNPVFDLLMTYKDL